MVKGLDIFREYFTNFQDQYVLIGGVACELNITELGGGFRATRDFDIVLYLENLNKDFIQQFWTFIHDGQYEQYQRNDVKHFYRFLAPQNIEFPSMIELFSRVPDCFQDNNLKAFTPIPSNSSLESLSAILLDNEYYQLLEKHSESIDDITVLEPIPLLLFKMKAWLNLSEDKRQGLSIRSKNIQKHKNDVLRLFAIIDPSQRFQVSETIYSDIQKFLVEVEYPSLQSLKSFGFSSKDNTQNIKDQLQHIFTLISE